MSLLVILLITAGLSLMPISELRGAIPFAIYHDIPWYAAMPFAVALNILVAPLCWLFLATVHKLFYGSTPEKGFKWYKSWFDRFIEKARHKLSGKLEKWGWIGISLFVGIPLPITGAWTGTIGAWVLGVSRRKTLLAVTIGVIISGTIVTSVVMFGTEAVKHLFIKEM